ncbi:4Fe-4S binding protein [Desulfovibrio sp. OttesenSCG-928-G11]|nr:4Fe-4S binding protein [Desulfovibrio sp. OttesenSCG-928-G11]
MQDNSAQSKLYRKIIQLTFSPENSNKPVMCHVVRHFDVTYNIMAAQTTPGKEGYLTVDFWGEETKCRAALDYLREQGIIVAPARQHVSRDDERCMHCGLCLALCPADALSVDPLSRLVLFNEEECTACGMCTRVCPVGAMLSDPAPGSARPEVA